MDGYLEFKEKLFSDDGFADMFKGKSPEDMVVLAAKEGFIFTAADVINNTELTHDELMAVSGGVAFGNQLNIHDSEMPFPGGRLNSSNVAWLRRS
ncbi:MAG: Nif11-like leader peptide family RiPP precursor [Defluviitaleaceae bacterium]|nr:Nif11-like leader peptide family RiPP precursor [Defluviitaleaceae bacterium]